MNIYLEKFLLCTSFSFLKTLHYHICGASLSNIVREGLTIETFVEIMIENDTLIVLVYVSQEGALQCFF